jgi:hypothetical protein
VGKAEAVRMPVAKTETLSQPVRARELAEIEVHIPILSESPLSLEDVDLDDVIGKRIGEVCV